MGSMIGSGVVTFLLGCVSAVAFFFMLVLGLNGYMGQQRAVNASFGTYVFLAAVIVLLTTALSVVLAGFLRRRFNWHAVLAVLLSSATFSLAAGIFHFMCVVVAAIVADGMRTGR